MSLATGIPAMRLQHFNLGDIFEAGGMYWVATRPKSLTKCDLQEIVTRIGLRDWLATLISSFVKV